MDKITLPLQPRAETDQARYIRRDNMIPAVVYGHDFKNLHLKVHYQTFRRIFEKATYSTIITLAVEGGGEIPVLVHDVQYDPVTDHIVHIDFYAVRMDEKVTTHIALRFVGVSEAVKLGAILSVNKHELEVSCLPGDLVHNIDVDISVLAKEGDTIRVGDIKAPRGIEILAGADEPVVSAIEPKEIIEEAPVAAVAEGAVPVEGEAAAEGSAEGEGKGESKGEGKGENKAEGKGRKEE